MKYIIILCMASLMVSCMTREERLERMNNTVSGIAISHPDKLQSHIAVDKTTLVTIKGHRHQVMLTYDYNDSTYVRYYIPVAIADNIAIGDTIQSH